MTFYLVFLILIVRGPQLFFVTLRNSLVSLRTLLSSFYHLRTTVRGRQLRGEDSVLHFVEEETVYIFLFPQTPAADSGEPICFLTEMTLPFLP